jgi:DNA-dependent RNA polymerase auxiliary subunit epsilon
VKLYRVGIMVELHGSVYIEAQTEEQAKQITKEQKHNIRDIEGDDYGLAAKEVYDADFVKEYPEEIV